MNDKKLSIIFIAFVCFFVGSSGVWANSSVTINKIAVSTATAPITPGNVVNVSVDAVSSTNEALYYRFYYRSGYGTENYDNSPWILAQDYSPSNSAVFSFPSEGDYIVVARVVPDPANEPDPLPIIGTVVSVGNVNKNVQITDFSSSAPSSIKTGSSVIFSINASASDNSPVYYKFYKCGDYGSSSDSWRAIQEYSLSGTCNHVFTEPGNYLVVARAVTDPANEPSALPIVGTSLIVEQSSDQGKAGKWSFAVVGDTHVTASNKTIAAEIAEAIVQDGARLALFPGDIVEGGKGSNKAEMLAQLEAWKEAMAPLYAAGIGVYPLRGNHEADVPNNLEAWNSAFSGNYSLPANGPSGETNLTYSFSFKNAIFMGLDNYANLHTINQSWFEQQISGNTSKPHVFVFGHESAFRAFHSDYLGAYTSSRDLFWKALSGSGARAYFCGHDHFFDIARMDDGDGNAENDIFQCIVGTGGGDLPARYAYNGDNSAYTPKPVFHDDPYGYLLVEISGEGESDLDVSMTWKKRTQDPSTGKYVYTSTQDVVQYSAKPRSSSTASGLTYPIVDTGQAKSYGNSSQINAPGQGQPFYGQDSQVQGRQPSYKDNGDGTITDLNTGLSWVKARGEKMSWDAALSGASSCRVGGYSDWRMPSIKELYSLINFNGKSGQTQETCIPYLDSSYFDWAAGGTDSQNSTPGNRVIDGQDWSATEYTGTTMQGDATIFGVNFIDGRIKGYPKYKKGPNGTSDNLMFVRYVRGNTLYGVNSFTANGDGTITDKATGLMWTQADSGTAMNWQDALAWVQTMNSNGYLGHNDWRMPDAKELQSIVDYSRAPVMTSNPSRQGPSIDPLFSCSSIYDIDGSGLQRQNYPYYWSSTTHLENSGGVYIAFGEALGWMKFGQSLSYTLADVHGAGAQRSDPKEGDPAGYPNGMGPQGDVVRILNYVRLVRNAGL